eukprot:CAMPEP_0172741964 /NCGR_PEP_ID=MMETSP1074-20121228/128384_1 /TAXON_ID=2916 /ORGANISM="Ceratium fusus, Strain PA161109" /LENGTH=405 /DNA_ID=CAMNT_0013572401 /DNA_START=50 /DNA_END=1265 /DNA_ORIENTATION=+
MTNVADELPPHFGPLAPALEALVAGRFSECESFTSACDILCTLLNTIAADPGNMKYRKINVLKSKIAQKLISTPGMEEALTSLGWLAPEAGDDGELAFTGDVGGFTDAVDSITAVAAWARRRNAGVMLVSVTSDPKGWSSELHDVSVLTTDPKFKGAVWDVTCRSATPDGVLVFHNSPFSNWLPCGQQVRVAHGGQDFSFSTSEHIIMAFKEHLLVGTALDATLKSQSAIKGPADSKAAAGRATRNAKDYSWWAHHGMQVLVGATACYLKFSQDEGLERLLLCTQRSILVETAPNDGAWGVAMNSSQFLSNADPEHFGVGSVAADTLHFEVNGKRFDRKHGEANALGKSLMLVREMLRVCAAESPASEVPELQTTVLKVCRHMDRMDLPFDWLSAAERLSLVGEL